MSRFRSIELADRRAGIAADEDAAADAERARHGAARPKGGAEGVLICHGGNVGGYTLFVKDKKLHYVHNYVGAEEFHVASNADVPEGKVSLAYEFEKTGEPDFKTGKGASVV